MQTHLIGAGACPLHRDVLNSQVFREIFGRYGTHPCAQAYADGCPTHTAYPSGHSTERRPRSERRACGHGGRSQLP